MNYLLAQIRNPALLDPELGGEAGVDGALAIGELMARLFRTVVIMGALALLLYLAWGGLSWITAGGDKTKVEEARSRITNSIMGMAVLVGTIAIAIILNWVFGFDLLSPSIDF